MDSEAAEAMNDEVELLQSIYEDGQVLYDPRREVFTAHCVPHIGDDLDKAFVSLTLQLDLHGVGYPANPPNLRVVKSTGVDQAQTDALLAQLRNLGDELRGDAMVYSLIECARECLSEYNTAGECSVCLEAFNNTGNDMLRTPCGHVFHTHCLAEVWRAAWGDQLDQLRKKSMRGTPHTSSPGPWDTQKGAVRGTTPTSTGSSSTDELWKPSRTSVVPPPLPPSPGQQQGLGVSPRVALLPLDMTLVWRDASVHCPACRHELGCTLCDAIAPWFPESKPSPPPSAAGSECGAHSGRKGGAHEASEGTAEDHPSTHQHQRPKAGRRTDKTSRDIAPGDLWEVVHYKGNHYRRKPSWDTKVKGGYIPKGATGVVEEFDGGEYIGVLWSGRRYWLPICGRSSGAGQWKILHFERPSALATEIPPLRDQAQVQVQESRQGQEEEVELQGGAESVKERARKLKSESKAKKKTEAEEKRKQHAERAQLKAEKRRQQQQQQQEQRKRGVVYAPTGARSKAPAVEAGSGTNPSGGERSQAMDGHTAQDQSAVASTPASAVLQRPNAKERRRTRRAAPEFGKQGSHPNDGDEDDHHGTNVDACLESEDARTTLEMAEAVSDLARNELARKAQRRANAGGRPAGEHDQLAYFRKAAQEHSRAIFKSESARVDAQLLVDYQTILEGHCKYCPNLLADAMDFTTCCALAQELELATSTSVAEDGSACTMVEWSRHLKHENPTFSATFNGIIQRLGAYFDVDVYATRLNFYRDGSDWKPFHHDSHAFGDNGVREDFTMGVSFGDSRALAFLHEPSGSQFAFPQNNGDVFAFTSEANRRFKHGVPRNKKRGAGPRFSIIAWGRRRSINDRNAGVAESRDRPIEQGVPPAPVRQGGHGGRKKEAASSKRQQQQESGITLSDDASRQGRKENVEVEVSILGLVRALVDAKEQERERLEALEGAGARAAMAGQQQQLERRHHRLQDAKYVEAATANNSKVKTATTTMTTMTTKTKTAVVEEVEVSEAEA